jgi:hypothetical protein
MGYELEIAERQVDKHTVRMINRFYSRQAESTQNTLLKEEQLEERGARSGASPGISLFPLAQHILMCASPTRNTTKLLNLLPRKTAV